MSIKEQEGKVEKGLETIPKTKVCKECGVEKPFTTEFFHKNPSMKTGLVNKCIVCVHKRDAERRAIAREEREKILTAPVKICTKCHKSKSRTTEFFNRDSQKRDSLSSSCKECTRKESRIYNKTPEAKIKSKEYSSTEAYKEKERKRANLPENKAKKKAYRQTPEYKARNKLRREAKKIADPHYTVKLMIRNAVKRTFNLINTHKSWKTFELILYSPLELVTHLNKGKYTYKEYLQNSKDLILYHLDHIIPLDYYMDKITINPDGTLTEDGVKWVRNANALRNLRIWPAWDNLSKGHKFSMDLLREYKIEDLLVI